MRNVKKRRAAVPFWGKLCAAVACAAVVMTMVGDSASLISASASSSQAQIEALEKKIKDLNTQNEQKKNQINAITGDISGNKAAIQTLSELIEGVNSEIDTCNELIEAKNASIKYKSDEIDAVKFTIKDKEREIEDKQLEIADLRAQNKKNLEQFAKLARAMYMNSSSDVMPILNGSDDWYDYFVYSDIVKDISRQNVLFMERLQNSIKQQETLIDELDRTITKLEQDKVDLEDQKAEYEKQKQELEEQQTQLTNYADEQQQYLSGLISKNKQLQSQISSLQAQINKNNQQIEKDNAELDHLIYLAQQENKDQTVYDDGFLWPVGKAYQKITTKFGYDPWRGGQHRAIDITGNTPGAIGGTKIYAAQSGTVITASATCSHNYGKSSYHSCGYGYGNYIVIDHGNGVTTLYAHCASLNVKKGQKVTKGETIGIVGTTGWSTGYHLHFEIRKNNTPVDPLTYSYQYI
ncbi:MAG: peptidoglycan DD-metalloendopeptidase family protein [Oscillospiraceae bacterium]|nr:peptidoglycan DD-metalloendopeptidase family protein [Oscillospiraceae bacterium]